MQSNRKKSLHHRILALGVGGDEGKVLRANWTTGYPRGGSEGEKNVVGKGAEEGKNTQVKDFDFKSILSEINSEICFSSSISSNIFFHLFTFLSEVSFGNK